jgi:hypothetical protein
MVRGMTGLGMNGRARQLAERMVAEADRLRVAVHTLDNGPGSSMREHRWTGV